MQIRQISDSEKGLYRSLAEMSGSVFNSPEWLECAGKKVQVFGIFNRDGRMTGGFHLFKDRLFFSTHVKNPPFTPSCGLFFENPAGNSAKKLTYAKSVMTAIAGFVSSRFSGIITFSFPPEITDMQPFYWKHFKVVPNYTYRIDLSMDEDDIFSAFSPERRNDIKKAVKDGLTVSFPGDAAFMRDIVIKTFDRQKDSINEKILDNILFRFARPANSFAVEVRQNSDIMAGVFCVFDSKNAYYLLGGYDPANRHSGAAALAVWEAIKKSREKGLKVFDFEGSMIPGVERFFRDFGGTLVPYFSVNKAPLLLEFPLKIIKRNKF
ncbi:MAG: GNAT family N-acetyltransferase [Bacteroidales bacterium]|nr:GNAT family N-acetyltransferase [Bacteroidales bacterium]